MAGIPRFDDGPWDTGRPPKRSWVQRVLLSAGSIGAVACLVASAFVARQHEQIENISRTEVATAEVIEGEPQNWLVVGSDSRDVIRDGDPAAGGFLAGGRANSAGQRSDSIMIVRVDPVGEHIDILSLPRDLWVRIARTDQTDRINTAYSYDDGPQRLIDTIGGFLDIDIHHYVEINFASFQGIVDAVGGVPMYFDKPVRDTHTGLNITELGCVKLNGEQALQYARSRYLEIKDDKGRWQQDPTSDYGRMSRQQFFMRRMFDKAAEKAKGFRTFDELLGVARKHVQLDDSIDVGEAADMVKKFGSFEGDSIRSFTLPVREVKKGGADVLELELGGTTPILNIFKGLSEHDADPRTLAFPVVNATGTPGRSQPIADAFSALSYHAEAGEDAPVLARTTVKFGFGGQDQAGQIERHLTAGADIQADQTMEPGSVKLVAGRDFTTVMMRPRPWAPPTVLPPPEAMGAVTTTTVAPTTTTTRKGQKSTATTAPTTLPHNDGKNVIGLVPGQPPEGMVCE